MERIAAQWQAKLADMQSIARQNGGMKYLLIVNNVFFKFVRVFPVYFKDAKAITEALAQLLTTRKFTPS